MDKPLSVQQKILAEGKACGLTDVEACKVAKYKANSDQAACNQVARMMKNDEFTKYFNELLKEAKSKAVMTAHERMLYLSRAIRTPIGEVDDDSDLCIEKTTRIETDRDGEHVADIQKIKKVDPLRALDLLNKMDGAYAPEKHEVSIGEKFFETLASKKGLHNDCD